MYVGDSMFSSNRDLLTKELKNLKDWYKENREIIKKIFDRISHIASYSKYKTKKSLLELADFQKELDRLFENNEHLQTLSIIHNNVKKYSKQVFKDIQNNGKLYLSINEMNKLIGKFPLSPPKDYCKLVTYYKIAENLFDPQELKSTQAMFHHVKVGHFDYIPSESFKFHLDTMWIPISHRKRIDLVADWMDESYRLKEFDVIKASIRVNMIDEKTRRHFATFKPSSQIKSAEEIVQPLKSEEMKASALCHSTNGRVKVNPEPLIIPKESSKQQIKRPTSTIVADGHGLDQTQASKTKKNWEKRISKRQDQFFDRRIIDSESPMQSALEKSESKKNTK